MQNHRWETNWPINVVAAARSRGYFNLTEMLRSMPAKPYAAVVEALGGQFAPVQIIAVQYKEAREMGTIREAAKDALCRNIIERFADGWRTDASSEFAQASALSAWSSEIQVTGDCPELKPVLQRFLKEFHPPEGWKPTGVDDPVITAAFDEFWPVVADQRIPR